MEASQGALALVGSGEYLPQMQEMETFLLHLAISRGKRNTFIQIPTGAGKEGPERLAFWESRGREQSERLDSQQIFLPILTREDAFNPDYISKILDAGLVYFSGGDPGYIAHVFSDSPLWAAIMLEWEKGSSLAGCSAGAMAFGSKIIGIRGSHITAGLGLIPSIEVIPHYDKFLGWLPDRISAAVIRPDADTTLLGIDENTAAVLTTSWKVYGEGKVHVLRSSIAEPGVYLSGETLPFLSM
jgi:cyanophycinase